MRNNLKGTEGHGVLTSGIGLEKLEDVEGYHIMKILKQVNGNKSAASKMLGISRFTLREKMKKYGIEEPA